MRDSRITRLLLFLLAAASVASAETSSDPFLSRKEIVLPPRSRTIDSVDVTASCGDIGSGRRFAIDGRSADWQGEPTWIAGTGRYDRGEYVWTDYPYDDDGTGSFQYPGEGEALIAEAGTIGKASPRQTRYGSNAADVVEVRVAADDAFVYFLVRLNFLNAVDSTVVGLGLHLDDDPSSGLSSWPLGAGLATPGIDLFVTAHGPCAMVSDGADGAPIDDVGGAAAVGTADNVLEIALPRALLGGAERFRLVGGSGLWNPTERGWMKVQATPRTAQNASDQPKGAVTDRDPEVFNLFFRGDETTAEGCEGSASLREECQLGTPRAFQSTRQHQVLSEQTSGAYEVALDLARIDDPADSSDPPLLRRGDEHDFTRVYRSRVATEGVWVVANNAAVFLGRYQPYAVTLPACLEEGDCPWPAGKPPLVVLPHGGGQSHLGSAPRASIPEGGTDLYGVETAYAALEAEIAPVSVRPLGRGQRAPWWRGMGEADFLEVLEDARTRYRTDRERQVTVGASLGGYGTIRLASLYPDLWSGAFGHCPAEFENSISGRDVGNVDPSTQPFVIDPLMPSLVNVPYRQASGTVDPLVPIVADHRLRDSAIAAGLDLRYTEYLLGGHCFDLAAATNPWVVNHVRETAALLRAPRSANPPLVRYRIDPRHYPATIRNVSEPIGVFDVRDLGVRYSGAYWVSDLRMRPEVEMLATRGEAPGGLDAAVLGAIDANSRAAGGWILGVASCAADGSAGLGSDGNPELTPPGPTPHVFECRRQTRSGLPAAVLDLSVRNLEAGTVDVAGAGFDPTRPFEVRAAGDGAFALGLKGVWSAAVTGSCVHGVVSGGGSTSVALDLGASACSIRVMP